MSRILEIWTQRKMDPRWVLLLAAILFGCNIWGYDLWAPDEPFFGEGAREMIVDGEWIVPHVNGEVNTHKPPLFFWLIALSSLPFGSVLSFTARLPSVLAALGSLILIMRLARRINGTRIAVLTGALLATTHIFWEKARMAQIDSLLCFLILVATSAFEAFRSGDWTGRRAGIVFWVATALAVLAKGPVGLLLPLGIALLTLAFDRELHRWRDFAPLTGPLAFVAVAGAWALAADLWVEDYSLVGALRTHFVDRAIHGMHHEQPVWYYLKVLPYTLLPWSFLLPGALLLAWRRRRQPEDRFLLVASLFVVLFFTISTEKRDLYILPAVPIFALMIARLIASILGWWSAASTDTRVSNTRVSNTRVSNTRVSNTRALGQRWVTLPVGGVAAIMMLAGLAVPFVAPRFSDSLIAPAAALAAALTVGGCGALAMAVRGFVLRSVQWLGATMATAMLVAVIFVYPPLNPDKSGRELATTLRDATAESRAAGRSVLAYDLDNIPRAVNFYSDGVYLQDVTSAEELISNLPSGAETYLLANKKTLPPLPEALRQRMSTVYTTRLSRKDLLLLRFQP